MAAARIAGISAAFVVVMAARAAIAVTLAPHPEVRGVDLTTVDVRPDGGAWTSAVWDALDTTPRPPGSYGLRLHIDGGKDGATLQVPPCAGRGIVQSDGIATPASAGPLLLGIGPGAHEVLVAVKVSSYERRIACGERPRVGSVVTTREGLGLLEFASPYGPRGGGQAVVFVPRGPRHAPSPERCSSVYTPGTAPCGRTPPTRSSCARRSARDVVLLMPQRPGQLALHRARGGRGHARDRRAGRGRARSTTRRVSIWGASMGGAGATTDRRSTTPTGSRPSRASSATRSTTSATYVRVDPAATSAAAHLVNALDVVDNARNVPVWLVHGEDDATSPIGQSEMLAEAMRAARVSRPLRPGAAHGARGRARGAVPRRGRGPRADDAGADSLTRVSYTSVRPWDSGAYGVRLVQSRRTRRRAASTWSCATTACT